MNSFKIISDNNASFIVDTQVFSMNIVHKVLYWLSDSFLIQSTLDGNDLHVELTSKQSILNWQDVEMKISQLFCDYSLRKIISEETKDIRNILYIKAFSNLDDFNEFESSNE